MNVFLTFITGVLTNLWIFNHYDNSVVFSRFSHFVAFIKDIAKMATYILDKFKNYVKLIECTVLT